MTQVAIHGKLLFISDSPYPGHSQVGAGESRFDFGGTYSNISRTEAMNVIAALRKVFPEQPAAGPALDVSSLDPMERIVAAINLSNSTGFGYEATKRVEKLVAELLG